jgi:aspartyl protease family protein
MNLRELWQGMAETVAAIPQSGLLVLTVAALLASWIGGAMARRRVMFGRTIGTLGTVGLALILVTVVLQVSRFDPRIDVAVPRFGLPEQVVEGGETRVKLANDGHFWLQVSVNGVGAPFLVDTGATLTAVSGGLAREAGLTPRTGGLPVRVVTANGTTTAQLTTIDRLRFGNIEASGLDAVIAPNLGRTNVIGMNLLSRLASLRFEGDTLVLVPKTGQAAGK